MKIQDCIECPKCHKRFLKSCGTNAKFGKEYFCHFCHTYFGVNELVNQWDYDAGDLSPAYPVTHADYKSWIPRGCYPYTVDVEKFPNKSMWNTAQSEFDDGEPMWDSWDEYVDAQMVVSRMFLGVEEVDDYADLLATQECALDIGVQ